MRAMIILPVLTLAVATAACQVTEDKNNSETSIQYNDQVAAHAVADVGNTATNIAGTIAADAKREAGKVDVKIKEHNDNEAAEDSASNSTTSVTKKNADGTTTTTTTTTKH